MSSAPPDPKLRSHIQNFYQALRKNDIEKLEELNNQGFPLDWVQSLAETSLPEYAMKHGSVEASWWLMAKGVMPESWSSFSGDAWKSFLKKGWSMVLKNEGVTIPLETYKNIIKTGVKTTGEHFPSWLEKSTSNVQTTVTSIISQGFGRMGRSLEAFLKTPTPTSTSQEIKATRVEGVPEKKKPVQDEAVTQEPSAASVPENKNTIKRATKKAPPRKKVTAKKSTKSVSVGPNSSKSQIKPKPMKAVSSPAKKMKR